MLLRLLVYRDVRWCLF
ncbi:hypothetical protein CGLO_00141 [Colletotrichum gloeosporioides Cg-14]|uniref:Uncharacterized protein n=1 Tax=Colletotrichum gloeosporioides (strain Cg-14) TaxID=1237896 RepID=T0KVC3_COLGC|nr:hypothetical protein CGLO_00141 [Colletotrichum gloeosporioides Cg-14]